MGLGLGYLRKALQVGCPLVDHLTYDVFLSSYGLPLVVTFTPVLAKEVSLSPSLVLEALGSVVQL